MPDNLESEFPEYRWADGECADPHALRLPHDALTLWANYRKAGLNLSQFFTAHNICCTCYGTGRYPSNLITPCATCGGAGRHHYFATPTAEEWAADFHAAGHSYTEALVAADSLVKSKAAAMQTLKKPNDTRYGRGGLILLYGCMFHGKTVPSSVGVIVAHLTDDNPDDDPNRCTVRILSQPGRGQHVETFVDYTVTFPDQGDMDHTTTVHAEILAVHGELLGHQSVKDMPPGTYGSVLGRLAVVLSHAHSNFVRIKYLWQGDAISTVNMAYFLPFAPGVFEVPQPEDLELGDYVLSVTSKNEIRAHGRIRKIRLAPEGYTAYYIPRDMADVATPFPRTQLRLIERQHLPAAVPRKPVIRVATIPPRALTLV